MGSLPEMAASGFLLSPLVLDRWDFAVLESNEWEKRLSGAAGDGHFDFGRIRRRARAACTRAIIRSRFRGCIFRIGMFRRAGVGGALSDGGS